MAKKPKKAFALKRKYLLALAGLLLVIDIAYQISLARQDVATRKAANIVAGQLEGYIDKHKAVPASLAAAGITNTNQKVRYIPANDTKIDFTFCADFKRNNDPPASNVSRFINLIWNHSTAKERQEGGIFGAISIDDLHTAGSDCQRVRYFMLHLGESAMSNQALYAALENEICGLKYMDKQKVYFNGFENTPLGTPDIKLGPPLENGSGTLFVGERTQIIADPKLKVVDANCTEVPLSSLKNHDVVTAYFLHDPGFPGSASVIAIQKL